MPTGNDYGGNTAPASTGGGPATLPTFTIVAGKRIIGNVRDYNKCFENIAGSSKQYSVTIAVDQTNPGSRSPWGFEGSYALELNSPFNVGHTFLIMSESGSGGTITHNVGFYPAGMVYPGSPVSEGQFNNDDAHDYNISLTITMDNSQFFSVLNFINSASDIGLLYNLNSNNCTNFALNALAAAGISLPSTKGSWLGGGGNNPGDLGEDIRSMSLPANMKRSSSWADHPNLGSCY